VEQENGDDSSTQSRCTRHEWWMGADYRSCLGAIAIQMIEVNRPAGTLQQLRWPPSTLRDYAQEACHGCSCCGRALSGSAVQLKFRWAAGGLGFMNGADRTEYDGDYSSVGAASPRSGYVHLNITGNREKIGWMIETRRCVGQYNKSYYGEREMLIGRNFGSHDVRRPDGNLYVVSLSKGRYIRFRG